tara:strand:- start:179 stop:709 length:531 start_codon:yes stop_codon:yes gene_type:complete
MKNKESIAQCKVWIFDCDGVLTNSMYHVREDGMLTKSFHTRDVWAIEELLKKGYFVFIVTQASDECVIHKFMGMSKRYSSRMYFSLGVENKLYNISTFLKAENLTWDNVAYMGDAENDLECMKAAFWSICPLDAVPIIQEHADVVCDAKGGYGAVHEIVTYFLEMVERIKKIHENV